MPAAEPIREQAKVRMAERLRTIQAGGQYWHTPSLVTRALLSVDQYANQASLWPGPIIGVLRSDRSTVAFDTTGGGVTVEHELIVDIDAYVRGDSDAPADTRLERAWQDIRVCLEMEPTLGGLASAIEPYGDLPMETDRGSWEPYAWMRQPYRVRLSELVNVS